MNRTKIDWCDYVWNPVWGCRTGCKYCYAKKFARRFAENVVQKEKKFWEGNEEIRRKYGSKIRDSSYRLFHPVKDEEHVRRFLTSFSPVFLISNFEKPFSGKPSKIFVNSMSDVFFWKREWMELVLERIRENSQHTFMFLTKHPDVYRRYEFPSNCWLGYSNEGDYLYPEWSGAFERNVKFLSLEPLLRYDSRELSLTIATLDWIIIGFQTNPYKPAPREHVEEIVEYAKEFNVPVFIKDNVYRAYPDLPELKEFPESKFVTDVNRRCKDDER